LTVNKVLLSGVPVATSYRRSVRWTISRCRWTQVRQRTQRRAARAVVVWMWSRVCFRIL